MRQSKNNKKKAKIPSKKTNPDIKKFIDFFWDAAQKIRGEKPVITHGKDGNLTKLALQKLTLTQLEQLAVWFLETKRDLSLTIGAMLSRRVFEDLKRDIERPNFFKEIDAIYSRYYSSNNLAAKLKDAFKPFNFKQICEIQESVARAERFMKRGLRQ